MTISLFKASFAILSCLVFLGLPEIGNTRATCESIFNNDSFADFKIEDLESLHLFTERLELKPIQYNTEIEEAATSVLMNRFVRRMSGDHPDLIHVQSLFRNGDSTLSQAIKSGEPLINFAILYDGQVIGVTQLVLSFRKIFVLQDSNISKTPRDNWFAVSCHLLPSHWGNRFAAEALRRTVRFAFETLNANAVFASARKANLSSMRALERVGLRRVKTLDHLLDHMIITKGEYHQNVQKVLYFKPAW